MPQFSLHPALTMAAIAPKTHYFRAKFNSYQYFSQFVTDLDEMRHRRLPRNITRREFRENQCIGSHTLLKGVNEILLYFIHFFFWSYDLQIHMKLKINADTEYEFGNIIR